MNDPTLNLLALLREQGITFTLESGVLLMHSAHGVWLSALKRKERAMLCRARFQTGGRSARR